MAGHESEGLLNSARPELPAFQSSRNTLSASPDSYVKSVISYAERSPKDFLHTGLHYIPLADLLKSSSSQNSITNSDVISDFAHVVVHEWSNGTSNCKTCSHAAEIVGTATRMPAGSNSGQLIFIRGFSNSEWLLQLSAQHRIEPEFLRRHLDFLLPRDPYDLPALPSTFPQGLSLRLVTICDLEVALTRQQLHTLQSEEEESVKKYLRQLGRSTKIGESIVRRWTVHDASTFTIEQQVSIFFRLRKGTWTATAWIDCGRDLAEGPSGPWLKAGGDTHSYRRSNRCRPIIQHLPLARINSGSARSDAWGSDEDTGTAQNLRHLPLQYGSCVDANVACSKAFSAMSGIFNVAAASESQFLNMMRAQIRNAVKSDIVQSHGSLNGLNERKTMQSQDCLASLNRMKILLDDHAQYLRATLECLSATTMLELAQLPQNMTTPGSPRGSFTDESSDTTETRRSLNHVITDFSYLLQLAENLSQRCLENTQLIINSTMLEESRRSIKVSEYAARLSLLAFLFLPLTFTTGFFGMNFQQFGQGTLSLWIFAIALVPTLLAVGLLFFWENVLQAIKKYLLPLYGYFDSSMTKFQY